jgi:hypothetical protein
VIGLAAVGFVSAQENDATPEAEEAPSEEAAPEGGMIAKGRIFEGFREKLAENLGISEEELTQAFEDTALALVDEAEADGDLTTEQADRLRERIEEGGFPLLPPPHVGGCRGGGLVRQTAEFLGIEVETVVEALRDEQSLAQVAEANGQTAEALSAHLVGELEARLTKAVENERLTQEQADEMLANAKEHIDEAINETGPLACSFKHHHFPGPGKFGGDLEPPGDEAVPNEETGLFF